MGTPQTFPMAFRASYRPEVPPQVHTTGRTAPGPYPPGSSRSMHKGRRRRFLAYSSPPHSPGPPHLAVLDTSRLCRGCSHPPRHHPDQAAPNFTALLRQNRGEGLSPPLESTAPHGANTHAPRRSRSAKLKIKNRTEEREEAGRVSRRQHRARERRLVPVQDD